LIIQAAALTEGHEIFMLDMGDEIRIDDLARKMIRMRGLRPEVDIKIVYPGIRPGEKLNEELHHTLENQTPTSHPRISRLTGEAHLCHAEATHTVGEVRTAVESPGRDDARRLIRDLTMGPAAARLEPARRSRKVKPPRCEPTHR
jgi:FlaA1/EpsC-like NDP-sugar epimerase